MQYFIKRFLIFLLPVALYALVVFIIDPYNYFSISRGIVSDQRKRDISYKISNPLFELTGFEKHPTPYVLLGSSQTGLLTPDVIKEYTGHDFANMSYGGGTLPEIISTFWELTKYTNLKEVYIGISFIDFNGSQYRNRVPEAIKIKANPASYIFSKSALRSSLLIMESIAFNQKMEIGIPELPENEFWNYQLDVTANRFYANHSYPVTYYEGLVKMAAYCRQNNIKLVIFIPPSHVDLQKKVHEFKFEAEEEKFRVDLMKLGDVYDFDFSNELTRERSNFSDPFHVKTMGSREVISTMFSGEPGDIVKFSKYTSQKGSR